MGDGRTRTHRPYGQTYNPRLTLAFIIMDSIGRQDYNCYTKELSERR